MVTLHSPVGDFETTFFAIMERLPDRIANQCAQTGCEDATDTHTEVARPYRIEFPLGGLNKYDGHTLNMLMNVALIRNREAGHRDIEMLVTVSDTSDNPSHISVFMKEPHFSHADAAKLRQQILDLRDDLFNPYYFESCELDTNEKSAVDSDKPYVERVFDEQDKDMSRALEALVDSYADVKVVGGRKANRRLYIKVEEETLREIMSQEKQSLGRPGRA